MAQKASSETPVVTTTDAAVVAIADVPQTCRNVRLVNGAVAGFFSVDAGTTWHRLPASAVTEFRSIHPITDVRVKRITAGTNLADVYASVW